MKYTKGWPTPELTKAQKVFNKLSSAGEEGVFSFDLVRIGGLRAAARILDLKKEGHNIISKPEKSKSGTLGCRYFLRS